MIARALMGAPDLLMLEDPSAGLAPPAIAAVAEALRGLTVLIADEQLALARAIADRIVLVEDGASCSTRREPRRSRTSAWASAYITGSSSTA